MSKSIVILGSTGSIGTQVLDVIEQFPDRFKVVGLAAHSNLELIEKQINKFKPKAVSLINQEKSDELRKKISSDNINIYSGEEGLSIIASLDEADMVVISIMGFSGLNPTLKALEAGKQVALANKEALVVAGETIMKLAEEKNINVIPIDSEHSAIFQCLQKANPCEASRLILTASGGPFLGFSRNQLSKVTPVEALQHPNWSMGEKITVDSATLMNKGLEILEARWLFNFNINCIDVVIHPESIVHSMVEFNDGSIMAQLGLPDMRMPIQYALTFPERWSNNLNRMNFQQPLSLNFRPPNMKTFPCLRLAYEAAKKGGTMPAVLNAANEVAVELFLKYKISFMEIPYIIEKAMNYHNNISKPNLLDIIGADKWSRKQALLIYQEKVESEC